MPASVSMRELHGILQVGMGLGGRPVRLRPAERSLGEGSLAMTPGKRVIHRHSGRIEYARRYS